MHASREALETYIQLGPLSITDFEKEAKKNKVTVPTFDRETRIREWETETRIYEGQVLADSLEYHGILRIIYRHGGIQEVCYESGLICGIDRHIAADGSYTISFRRRGKMHGVSRSYDVDGELILETTHQNGRL